MPHSLPRQVGGAFFCLIQINAGGWPLWQGLAVSREVGASPYHRLALTSPILP